MLVLALTFCYIAFNYGGSLQCGFFVCHDEENSKIPASSFAFDDTGLFLQYMNPAAISSSRALAKVVCAIKDFVRLAAYCTESRPFDHNRMYVYRTFALDDRVMNSSLVNISFVIRKWLSSAQRPSYNRNGRFLPFGTMSPPYHLLLKAVNFEACFNSEPILFSDVLISNRNTHFVT